MNGHEKVLFVKWITQRAGQIALYALAAVLGVSYFTVDGSSWVVWCLAIVAWVFAQELGEAAENTEKKLQPRD